MKYIHSISVSACGAVDYSFAFWYAPLWASMNKPVLLGQERKMDKFAKRRDNRIYQSTKTDEYEYS